MTNNIKNVCVFASSSNSLDEVFHNDAQELGTLLGKNGFNIVYGGSRRGLMYACASAVKSAGGKVCGIMPERIANFGCSNPDDCDEFYITKGMRERKALLDEKSDAVIALAGGYGTIEELFEMIVQKQLGYCNKPIVILNTDNFYRGILIYLEDTINRKFAHSESHKLYYIANTPSEAVEYIQNYQPQDVGAKYAIK